MPSMPEPSPKRILVVDVGGTRVKLLVTGQTSKRTMDSGPRLTPRAMVAGVKKLTADWEYDVVSLGVPAPVVRGRVVSEPVNLATGWIGFDFAEAFACPVEVINDAALQAVGACGRGRVMFLGSGPGLGSALVLTGNLERLDIGHLPYRKGRSFEDYVGKRGFKRLGKKRWRKHVLNVVALLRRAFLPEDVVLGGGNAKHLRALPEGTRIGANAHAFKGGYALWKSNIVTDA